MTPAPALPRTRLTGAFERRVARALTPHLEAIGIADDATLVVACSGGPDSLATLVAVARSRPSGTVVAAHFDHRLRPPAEVARESDLVRKVAARLGLRIVAGQAPRVPVGRSEAAARDARYRWLARVVVDAGALVCATGHTLDDQAETVLLRLARGTGLRGAGGMEARAPWPVPVRGQRPHLLRPLLDVPRRDVEAYLAALGLDAARDPSNDTLDFARNRVRQRVLPELRTLNPRAAERIAAFAAGAREDEEALHGWAARAFAEHGAPGTECVRLDRAALLALPLAVAMRVVRIAAAHLGVALEREHAEAVLHAAYARGRRAALPAGLTARREGDSVVIARSA